MICSAFDVACQGELEHRTAKSRYLRTNRKAVTKQLAAIERRQVRLRRLQEKLGPRRNVANVVVPSNEPYHVGKSQDNPIGISQFLEKNKGDPAVTVC
jgi:uncharacterized coiled-coil protein SlyX